MSQRASLRRAAKVRRGPGATARTPARAEPYRPWLVAAGTVSLLVAVVVGYLPSLDGGMQFDDTVTIERNLALKDLGRFLGSTLWHGLGHGSRVIADLTFALNYAQGRLEPRPYHVTSVLCHLLATLVVFLLGRRLLERAGWSRPAGPALAATALWALHPLNSQAVSYIVQRAEVLASIGYAGAVLLVLEAARRGRTPAGVACYAGALVAALLGFESKPILVSLPAAVLAALWVAELPERPSGRRQAWPARLALSLPFGLAALRYGNRTIAASAGTVDMGFDIPTMRAVSYPASQVRVVLTYLRQLLWPDGLSLDHDIAPSHGWLEPAVLASGAVLLLLVGGTAFLAWRANQASRDSALARASRVMVFGLAWWFILLSPTSSVVPLADLMMDHRPYLASWGLLVGGVAMGAALLERRFGQGPQAARAGIATTALLALALAVALHGRNGAWASPEATWNDVVEKNPGLWRGWQNLAQIAWERGDYRSALERLRRALPLATRPEEKAATLRNMSANLIDLGALDEAISVIREAERLHLQDADLEINASQALTLRGEIPEAEAHARRAIELSPGNANAHAVLGQLLGRRGDHAGALAQFRRAVDLDPDALRPLQGVATALELLGRPLESCAAWRQYGQIPAGSERARLERQRLGCGRLETAPQ